MRYLILMVVVIISCQSPKKRVSNAMGYEYLKNLTERQNGIICDTSIELTVHQAIEFVKIYNTISQYSLENRDIAFSIFDRCFSKYAFLRVVKLLGMQLSIGMSYYSEKYNLQLGALKSATDSYYQMDSVSLNL